MDKWFIPNLIMYESTYLCWDSSWTMLIKGETGSSLSKQHSCYNPCTKPGSSSDCVWMAGNNVVLIAFIWPSTSYFCYHTHFDHRELCARFNASCRYAMFSPKHYNDVIMGEMGSQITSLIVFSLNRLFADPRKHQSSASLAFVRGFLRWQMNFPQNGK